jgi:CheY-like chemotaxis protein
MLQNVVNVTNFRIDEKNLKFTVHIDKAIPDTLIADSQRLAQVVTNLLSNAVKFTPEHGSIHLSTSILSESNGICVINITVTDTGIGINQEQQSRLFQSFQQAESSTSRKYGGTGLGLSISKKIVEMMGGEIWVQSELDKGSTFAFTIQAKCGSKKKHALLDSDINLEKLRILAVDDDPDVLTFFTRLMQEFGISCDTALSGEDALLLTEQNGAYSIYFINWKMPGLDGIELTRELRKKTSVPGKSIVIMISAAEWNVIEDEAKKTGIDKFLSKPLFPSTIADVIVECIGDSNKGASKSQSATDIYFEGNCILLVEDVEINREIVIAMLEQSLVAIDCAETGAEAVKKFSENHDVYDLILMDIQMPGVDGYEATRRIRSLDIPKARIIPIIALTANVFKEDIEKCLSAGMNDHLGKPIDVGELLDKLKLYLPKVCQKEVIAE